MTIILATAEDASTQAELDDLNNHVLCDKVMYDDVWNVVYVYLTNGRKIKMKQKWPLQRAYYELHAGLNRIQAEKLEIGQ